jgi:predicted DNA-binding transcriptional regulator YafY
LGRIYSSFVTGESFEKREFKREDIPLNYWSNEVESIDVLLEIRENAFADAQDWLGVENLQKRGDKWVADLSLPNDQTLVKKIIGLGDGVIVKEPQTLRNEVKRQAQNIAKLYQ